MVQLLDVIDESEDETWGKSTVHIGVAKDGDQAEGSFIASPSHTESALPTDTALWILTLLRSKTGESQ